MKLTILSIKMNELVMPGYSLSSDLSGGYFAYYEAFNGFELNWKKRKQNIYRGHVVIGKRREGMAEAFSSLWALSDYGKHPHEAEVYSWVEEELDNRLIKIHRYIRVNYDKPITLPELADLANCNPMYLSNTFSKVFGISPVRYLQNIRMNQAALLLKETSLTIKEVTNQVGYISNSQFTELFKRHYNMTPTDYRMKMQNK